MGRIIGIIAIKGGVGKTSCAANLGAAFASFNKKVLVVDANFSAPNLAFHFGFVNAKKTIHDVLTNKADMGEALYQYTENLHILPGSLMTDKVNPFKLREKLSKVKNQYDIILVDSSPNLNDEMLATMVAADDLLVVTSPDYPTLSCTMHAVKVAKERKTPIKGLLLNMVRNKSFELSIEDIEEATGVPVIGCIPNDVKVPESIAYTSPATEYSPMSDVAQEFKHIAAAVLGQEYKDTRLLSALKRMFLGGPRKDQVNRDLLRQGQLW